MVFKFAKNEVIIKRLANADFLTFHKNLGNFPLYFLSAEAVIAFTKRVVDVKEDQTAVMEIGFTSGSSSSPVTVT